MGFGIPLMEYLLKLLRNVRKYVWWHKETEDEVRQSYQMQTKWDRVRHFPIWDIQQIKCTKGSTRVITKGTEHVQDHICKTIKVKQAPFFINWRNNSSLAVLIIHNPKDESKRKSEFHRRGLGPRVKNELEKGTLLCSVLTLFFFTPYLI